ncbi:hypothetical protein, partial [Bacillus cereus]|uniref:hypothetical protein n=1 Tax=Bacillus cereus TaxID=1396 RepID=UPI00197AE980
FSFQTPLLKIKTSFEYKKVSLFTLMLFSLVQFIFRGKITSNKFKKFFIDFKMIIQKKKPCNIRRVLCF